MLHDFVIDKVNLDSYLKALGKAFRKLNGTKTPAEIIIVGGASILINYGFRDMTTDIDAIIQASSAMKEAINIVRDEMNLPNAWINTDFKQTCSYSSKLVHYSKYYKTFSNILEVRTISGEYLIAMKLMSGRNYKNDLSDIVGILIEQEAMNKPITLDNIKKAVIDLYGSYDEISNESKTFIENIFRQGNYRNYYLSLKNTELNNFNSLVDFEGKYPDVLTTSNLNEILNAIHSKQKQ